MLASAMAKETTMRDINKETWKGIDEEPRLESKILKNPTNEIIEDKDSKQSNS